MEEVWKSIPKYEGRYEVRSIGRVKSYCKGGVRILKHREDKRGYRDVCLMDSSGKITTMTVHRLMMLAFHGERPKGYHICHNNGAANDNRLENLRYDTAKSNIADKIAHGRVNNGAKNGRAKLSESAALTIFKSNESSKKLAEQFSVSIYAIFDIRSGRSWSSVTNIK